MKDINAGSGNSIPRSLTNVSGTLFFAAFEGTTGIELWKSDGTEVGTVLVKDFAPGGASSGPAHLTSVKGTLLFAATLDPFGIELLWISPDIGGVKDINPGSGSSAPSSLIDVGGTLFFAADDGTAGEELWKATIAPSPTLTPTPVPGITLWGLAAMSGMLALALVWAMRRRGSPTTTP